MKKTLTQKLGIAFFGAVLFGFIGSLFGDKGVIIGVIFGIIIGFSSDETENKIDAELVDISNVKSEFFNNTSDKSKNNAHNKKFENNDEKLVIVKRQVNNPFFSPIAILFSNVVNIKWSFPYIPQIIELLVLLISIFIMLSLYVTVGIVSQIESVLMNLIMDTGKNIKDESAVEKSAYAVIAGIYIIFWFPFWIIILPFNVLGWFWKNLGYYGFIFLISLILLLYFMANNFDESLNLFQKFNTEK